MPNKTFTLTNDASGKATRLEALTPTLGNDALNIANLTKEQGLFTFDPGFVVTAACESKITYIDGDQGVLLYRGYPIEQLAEKSSFLEVAFLLIYGELPTATQLKDSVAARAVTDQAKGILMHVLGCDADEALRHLRRESQRRHVKVTEVAAQIVATSAGGGHGTRQR